MQTTATILADDMANVVGKDSELGCILGEESSGGNEGKGYDGSMAIEIGLVSGDWSLPLTASAATFTIAS